MGPSIKKVLTKYQNIDPLFSWLKNARTASIEWAEIFLSKKYPPE